LSGVVGPDYYRYGGAIRTGPLDRETITSARSGFRDGHFGRAGCRAQSLPWRQAYQPAKNVFLKLGFSKMLLEIDLLGQGVHLGMNG